jgi:RimJ/RimL family protein N-acetyltransferase
VIDTRAAEAFAVSAARSIHPLVRSWYDDAELIENVRLWLAPELRLAGDADSAREFAAAWPVPGCSPADYGYRVVTDVVPGLDVVAGIRFRSDEAMAPWVDVLVSSRPVADADERAEISRALNREFARFTPRWAGFFCAADGPAPPGRLPGEDILAARVADLRAAAAASDDSVVLRRANASSCHDQYLGLYRAFHAEHPRNAELASVEDVESLAGYEQDGGLFEIRVDGFFAGFCGARRWPRYGVRGWVGGEIILANRFRGQGLAAPVHRRMAQAIPASPGDAIWASVHEENVRSRRAGLSAGYSRIGRTLRIATGA